MTPERYRRAGELYYAALELEGARRREFLERACDDDTELIAEVESLLIAHDDADSDGFIETPPEEVSAMFRSLADDTRVVGDRDQAAAPAVALGRPLEPGQQLGRYRVVELLGSGGMGSVYRAVDTTLGREVAIKALAPTFRGDSASLRRFEREARVLATLNHPNIATIYGFERLDGAPYLVLEHVEGETLADRLRRGALPLELVVDVGQQIVAGLEEAHAKGVIHRDLKPSNVMLTPDGRVKVVDFGLAKQVRNETPTSESGESITTDGVVLGTARYMSPEQVRGEAIDTRTDVWAFGCVLYEMLTTRPAFGWRSVSEVVAAVLRDEPDWRAVPATTPRNMLRLLRRSLRRDLRSRLQHIGDARLELLEPEIEAAGAAPPARSRWTAGRVAALVTLAAIGAAAASAYLQWRPRPSSDGVLQASFELPSRLRLSAEFSAPFAIAPAGSPIVFEAAENGVQRLYSRTLHDSAISAIDGTAGARQPFFSPDGAWIGFFADRKLAKVPVGGGAMLQLADIGGNPRGAAWIPDGTIVVAPTQTSGLVRIPEGGGKPAPLTTVQPSKGEYSHRWPDVLPGGKWVIFTVGLEDSSFDEAHIEAVSVASGERRLLVPDAGFARYLPDGRLMFVRGGRLHAVPFDPETLAVSGTPAVVLNPVRYDWRNGGAHLAVSASGVLMYAPGEGNSSDYFLTWADREGRLTRATDTPRLFRDINTSPDGQRIAAIIGKTFESDLWIIDSNRTLSRLTYQLSPHRPTWTPRGDKITIGVQKNDRWQLVTVVADGTQAPTLLHESPNRLYPNSWSPDGRYLIFQESRPESGWDLRVLQVDASGAPIGEPRSFGDTPFHETTASFSRNGRWIAYESDELDGVVQVYARAFPDGARKVRITLGGARWPAWDAQGNLFFWDTEADNLQVVQTREHLGQLVISPAQPVWRGNAAAMLKNVVITVTRARYDVDPTGLRFLVLEKSAQSAAAELSLPIVVTGWTDDRRTAR